jgi:hypothetical protein
MQILDLTLKRDREMQHVLFPKSVDTVESKVLLATFEQ